LHTIELLSKLGALSLVKRSENNGLDNRRNLKGRHGVMAEVNECGDSVLGGEFALIGNHQTQFGPRRAAVHSAQDSEGSAVNYQPRPLFFAHYSVGVAHLSQGGENKHNRSETEGKPGNSGSSHNLSKKSHLLLSIKVLIDSVMVAGRFYLLMNTVPHGYRLKTETFFINTILGVLYMVLGALFAAYSLFGLLGW
jgi:hypothetical protein